MTQQTTTSLIAVIREDECIGCTKCIQACPFDAIIGAQQLMHTVIADACIGCKLCIPPCPVNCIDLIELPEQSSADRKLMAKKSRERYKNRKARLEREEKQAREQYLKMKESILRRAK